MANEFIVKNGLKVMGNTLNTGTITSSDFNGKQLNIYKDAYYVGLKSPTLAADKTYTLPATDGNNGNALVTNGSGILSWVEIGGSDASGEIDGSGVSNYLAKWTNPKTIGNSILFDNGVGLGIGTTTIDNTFSVNGSTSIFAIGQGEATGGTMTEDDDYYIHTFTSNGTFNVPSERNVEILLVAGGGGGGKDWAGGGGAGGVVHVVDKRLDDTTYSVIIGEDGTGGADLPATNGGNSIFMDITAYGGGYGGPGDGSSPGDGGSGGGRGGAKNTRPGGTGLQPSSDGNDGGIGYGTNGGSTTGGDAGGSAGGGGAGSVGIDGTDNISGNGGSGYASSISGVSTWYAGGGGGGGINVPATGFPVAAGTGTNGGGNGGYINSEAGANATTYGSGGGGGAGSYGNGGNGKQGILIIKYPKKATIFTFYASNTGKVGIGTLLPLSELQVVGDVLASGSMGIGNTNPSSFKLEITGDIGPSTDNTYKLGGVGRRWSTIYAATTNIGDLGMAEKICEICHKTFVVGDKITMVIKSITENSINMVPICKSCFLAD